MNYSGIELPKDLHGVLEKGLKTPISSQIKKTFFEALNSMIESIKKFDLPNIRVIEVKSVIYGFFGSISKTKFDWGI